MMSKDIKMLLSSVLLVSALTLGESLPKELKREVVKRVIGGSAGKDGQFPYAIALYDEGRFTCTGSIISETSILTAAQCVVSEGEPRPIENLYAIAGVANTSSSQGVFIEFKAFKVHPEYDDLNSDLAIMETTAPIKFNDRVKAICIANDNIGSLELSRVAVVGWGQTNRINNVAMRVQDTVQYEYQRVIGNLECQELFPSSALPSSVLCAKSPLSGICYGDSGGPLVYNVAGAPVLVGLASYIHNVFGCGTLSPSVFTRISSYKKYIKDNATGDVCVA